MLQQFVGKDNQTKHHLDVKQEKKNNNNYPIH